MSDDVKAWLRFLACLLLFVAEKRPFIIQRKDGIRNSDPLPAWINIARLPL